MAAAMKTGGIIRPNQHPRKKVFPKFAKSAQTALIRQHSETQPLE
jgi:hypothetical protein